MLTASIVLNKVSRTKGLKGLLTIENLKDGQIEVCTRGQCCNDHWYLCRKGVITASKAHEVIKYMKKIQQKKRCGCNKHLVIGRKNFWNDICQSKDPSFKRWKRHGDSGNLGNTLKTTTRTALFQNVSYFSKKVCHTLGQD